MKILVLMKRFGANKDMVLDNFGRQVRLFEELSKLGHKIDFFCPDYKKHERKNIKKNRINYYVRPYSLKLHFKFSEELKQLIKKNNYDIIVGSTDPLWGILGYRYSKKFNILHIYDMQDDYSSYESHKNPLVRHFDRIAVKNSELALTVSDSLNKNILKLRKKPTITIQNGFDAKDFSKTSKETARKKLKLPKGKIVIYAGEISKFKGVDVLVDAFAYVAKKIPGARLLLTGKIIDVDVKRKYVIYEQYPKRKDLMIALYAADAAVLPNIDNKFSRYCFPYKLVEYMAAGLPIVATKVGDAPLILSKYSKLLCDPNNKNDMAEKLIYTLKSRKKPDYRSVLKNLTWQNLAKKLDGAIKNKLKWNQ
ncbi:MAG TPA: glycosyltransferase family 4 protein [Candidatus Nanoarchaeia archaeon]|nr:glycosyltransferase family 4 protein [Candidatus Nanoarchaeia archaeon]